jgi:hypothetical protein
LFSSSQYSSLKPLVPRWYREFLHEFWHLSREPTAQESESLLKKGAGSRAPDFISWFQQKAQNDESMSAELTQVADGFAYRVRTFSAYDVNGYRFHTTMHEQCRPNRTTTNSGVFTRGDDEVDYYGRVEEIYELSFDGWKPLNPVIFKCHWFDPAVTRKTPNLGLVEIRQDCELPGEDVYVVAQQATQVYYLPYPCQTKEHLKGWYVVNKVSPHGKLPMPNDDDYVFDPNTYAGEFFQEEGLEGSFTIDLTDPIGMDINYERVVEDDDGDEVENAKDIELLRRLHIGDDNYANILPSDGADLIEMYDSDDPSYDPANPDHEEYF